MNLPAILNLIWPGHPHSICASEQRFPMNIPLLLCYAVHILYSQPIRLRQHKKVSTVFPRKDATATIYFSSTAIAMQWQCGDYSRAATIRSTDVLATIYFSTTTMWQLFEGGYYSRCDVYSTKYGISYLRSGTLPVSSSLLARISVLCMIEYNYISCSDTGIHSGLSSFFHF